MAGRPTDVKLKIAKNSGINDLKDLYIKQTQENLKTSQIRYFFSGKELKEGTLIAEYGLDDEDVVQMIKK